MIPEGLKSTVSGTITMGIKNGPGFHVENRGRMRNGAKRSDAWRLEGDEAAFHKTIQEKEVLDDDPDHAGIGFGGEYRQVGIPPDEHITQGFRLVPRLFHHGVSIDCERFELSIVVGVRPGIDQKADLRMAQDVLVFRASFHGHQVDFGIIRIAGVLHEGAVRTAVSTGGEYAEMAGGQDLMGGF